MDNTRKRIASLQRELVLLQSQLAERKRDVIANELVDTKEAPLIRAHRDRLVKRVSRLERRIAVLRDEPEEVTMSTDYDEELLNGNDSVEVLIAERSVTDPDVLAFRDIKEHARLCDEHAAGLARHVKALHQAITAQRMKHNGRGPSAGIVTSALERAFARHVVGTPLRSLRGPAPLPHHTGFASQIAIWEGMLVPSSTPAPPPPPPRSPVIAA